MELERHLLTQPATFLFRITNPRRLWIMDFRTGMEIREVEVEEPVDTVIIISDADFTALAIGKLSGPWAFISGRMSVQGSILASTRLGGFFTSRVDLRERAEEAIKDAQHSR